MQVDMEISKNFEETLHFEEMNKKSKIELNGNVKPLRRPS